ncbi:MAG: hypothetical protein HYR63_28400 [Proteobacteria bacterium]|nr:hypothetical protein [Pseudomonadota bacterium]MBI3499826.1 hypothetical protein [Pseudomonadota bacterium]
MDDDLIATAKRLANASTKKKPKQADLKRAVSTAYYAVFHAMARDAADLLLGVGQDRPDKAWAQTYRALEHGFAKNACGQVRGLGFPPDICSCADAFVSLQQARHDADYDPSHRVTRAVALAAVAQAEQAIGCLRTAPRKDRKAFAVQLLLKKTDLDSAAGVVPGPAFDGDERSGNKRCLGQYPPASNHPVRCRWMKLPYHSKSRAALSGQMKSQSDSI